MATFIAKKFGITSDNKILVVIPAKAVKFSAANKMYDGDTTYHIALPNGYDIAQEYTIDDSQIWEQKGKDGKSWVGIRRSDSQIENSFAQSQEIVSLRKLAMMAGIDVDTLLTAKVAQMAGITDSVATALVVEASKIVVSRTNKRGSGRGDATTVADTTTTAEKPADTTEKPVEKPVETVKEKNERIRAKKALAELQKPD